MKNLILGKYPVSTIIGYLLAGLMAFQQFYNPAVKWYEWIIPFLIAVLGRVVSDGVVSKYDITEIGGGGIKNPPKP